MKEEKEKSKSDKIDKFSMIQSIVDTRNTQSLDLRENHNKQLRHRYLREDEQVNLNEKRRKDKSK